MFHDLFNLFNPFALFVRGPHGSSQVGWRSGPGRRRYWEPASDDNCAHRWDRYEWFSNSTWFTNVMSQLYIDMYICRHIYIYIHNSHLYRYLSIYIYIYIYVYIQTIHICIFFVLYTSHFYIYIYTIVISTQFISIYPYIHIYIHTFLSCKCWCSIAPGKSCDNSPLFPSPIIHHLGLLEIYFNQRSKKPIEATLEDPMETSHHEISLNHHEAHYVA